MAYGDRASGNICAAKVRIVRWRRRGGGEIACADDELSWIVGRLDKGSATEQGRNWGRGSEANSHTLHADQASAH